MYERDSNVKLVIRLRNPKEENAALKKTNSDDTTNSNKVQPGGKPPKNGVQNTKQGSKSPALGKKPVVKEESKKPVGLKEGQKYTIFTANEPSDTVCITNKAIAGRLINTSCRQTSDLYDYSHNLMKDSVLLEFDRVYNETHSVDTLYLERIKDRVSNMFQGTNSAIMFFGPTEGGKSYLCRGFDVEDGGLLGRGMNELLNLIEISQQANAGKVNKSTYFTAGFSCYQIYNDTINDLLSTNPARQLQIRTYYDHDSGQCFTQIVDLVKKDIKSKKEFDNTLEEAIHNRKLLAQTMKINELKKKSHIVFSIILEKRDKSSEGVNKVTEKSIEKFAQLDFVELASSDIGLPTLKSPESDYLTNDDINAKAISKNFDTLSSNIVATATNTPATKDSKLSLALKPTLNPEADCILFGCVHSTEDPPINSVKALKFINWIRNQIVNVKSDGLGIGQNRTSQYNTRNKNKSVSKLEDSDEEVERGDETQFHINYRGHNTNEHSGYKNSHVEKEYVGKSNRQRYMYEEDEEDSYRQIEGRKNIQNTPNHQIKTKNRADRDLKYVEDNASYSPVSQHRKDYFKNKQQYELNDSDGQGNTDGKYRSQQRGYDKGQQGEQNNRQQGHYSELQKGGYSSGYDNQQGQQGYFEASGGQINAQQGYYSGSGSQQDKQQTRKTKIGEYEKSARHIESQSFDNTRSHEQHRVQKSQDQSRYNLNSLNNMSVTNFNDYENERMRQEFYTIKSDNILYKEEINLLLEKNLKLEEDLKSQHYRNLELAAEVERAQQERNLKQKEVDKMKGDQAKAKIAESTMAEHYNYRFATESKMRELEQENRKNYEEKQRFEIDLRVLQERFNELKKVHEGTETELNIVKQKQHEELNSLESRLIKTNQELDFLQRENNKLRLNEERLRSEVSNLEKHRDNLNDKYQDYKGKNNILNAKLADVENEVKKLLYEKNQEILEKQKDEGTKKSKLETKQRILNDMQSKITSYKNKIMKSRTRDESP